MCPPNPTSVIHSSTDVVETKDYGNRKRKLTESTEEINKKPKGDDVSWFDKKKPVTTDSHLYEEKIRRQEAKIRRFARERKEKSDKADTEYEDTVKNIETLFKQEKINKYEKNILKEIANNKRNFIVGVIDIENIEYIDKDYDAYFIPFMNSQDFAKMSKVEELSSIKNTKHPKHPLNRKQYCIYASNLNKTLSDEVMNSDNSTTEFKSKIYTIIENLNVEHFETPLLAEKTKENIETCAEKVELLIRNKNNNTGFSDEINDNILQVKSSKSFIGSTNKPLFLLILKNALNGEPKTKLSLCQDLTNLLLLMFSDMSFLAHMQDKLTDIKLKEVLEENNEDIENVQRHIDAVKSQTQCLVDDQRDIIRKAISLCMDLKKSIIERPKEGKYDADRKINQLLLIITELIKSTDVAAASVENLNYRIKTCGAEFPGDTRKARGIKLYPKCGDFARLDSFIKNGHRISTYLNEIGIHDKSKISTHTLSKVSNTLSAPADKKGKVYMEYANSKIDQDYTSLLYEYNQKDNKTLSEAENNKIRESCDNTKESFSEDVKIEELIISIAPFLYDDKSDPKELKFASVIHNLLISGLGLSMQKTKKIHDDTHGAEDMDVSYNDMINDKLRNEPMDIS